METRQPQKQGFIPKEAQFLYGQWKPLTKGSFKQKDLQKQGILPPFGGLQTAKIKCKM